MIKALFILEVFTFLSWFFGYAEKPLDKKAMVNFKIYDIIDWKTNNYNAHVPNISRKKRQTDNEIWSVNGL